MSPLEAAVLALRWLLPAFAVTAFTEIAVAALLGLRTQRELAVVALANLVTNPAVNLLVVAAMAAANARTLAHPRVLVVFIALEALTVVAEWRIYERLLPFPRARALTVSVVANVASLLVGLVVFGVGAGGM